MGIYRALFCHLTKSLRQNYTRPLMHHWYTSQSSHSEVKINKINSFGTLFEASDHDTGALVLRDMTLIKDFVSEDEERQLMAEIETYMKRLHYEYDHWDDAIHGFRETEKKNWQEKNRAVIQRIRDVAFPPNVGTMDLVHVLDLAPEGYIKPHIDSVRFCGPVIVGLSLLSDSVLRLEKDKEPSKWAKLQLPSRSLYIMRKSVRYDFSHAILKHAESYIGETHIPRDRRITIMCRMHPD